jgi:hypothetical protein
MGNAGSNHYYGKIHYFNGVAASGIPAALYTSMGATGYSKIIF